MKRYKLLILTVILYILAFAYDPKVFASAVSNTGLYLKEMIQILPAVFILTGLLNAWVPHKVVEAKLGKESGLFGRLISLFLGAVSAGPVYVAFPLVQSLLGKGMSVGNAVILISAWAAAKVPMFLIESRFLGIGFASLRTPLTVIAILIMGALMDRMMSGSDIILSTRDDNKRLEAVVALLPNQNCLACGHKGCLDYAKAVLEGGASTDLCRVGEKGLSERLASVRKESL
ncbi:MAG: permease [Actinomycetota bacterium]|nr:permease [Actinomycetota bacterium]